MPPCANPLATVEQLTTRVQRSGMSPEIYDAAFSATVCLTQAAGVLLEQPQDVIARACVVLARYWVASASLHYEYRMVSAAVLYTVMKQSAKPMSSARVCIVYSYLGSPLSSFRSDKEPLPFDASAVKAFSGTRAAFEPLLIEVESHVLYTLSFDTHVALPYAMAISYLQALDFFGYQRHAITSRVVEYLNTALISPQLLYLTHQPNELAVAAMYLAARDVGAKMPTQDWWEVFDVDRESLGFLACALSSVEGILASLYRIFPNLAEGVVTLEAVQAAMASQKSAGIDVAEDVQTSTAQA
ncbi:putative cyclin-L1-like protein [Ceratocystis lukuohia]|uniref:Cyclin-L1-like protein n=2 Tax=Ceratocystis TaxID=5157 RepID=A0ABR4MTE9_9PEZI|nr:putative cyclin-L1-like protein [Ceratocystis fimbriata CBS 114723]